MPLRSKGSPSRASHQTRRVRFFVSAVGLLVLGISLSLFAASFVRVTNARLADTWLHDHAAQIEMLMASRLENYSDALVHTRALFHATGKIDPHLLHRYLESVHLDEKYPGILGIGFVASVSAARLPAFVQRMRKASPGYHVWPRHSGDHFLPVTFFEPETRENRRVIGFDTSVWQSRREAQQRAVLTNQPAATEKISLARDFGAEASPGFVLYLPIFRPGMALTTPEDRQRALLGLVHTVFRVDPFLSAVLGERPLRSGISFSVYDGPTTDPATILFQSNPASQAKVGPRRLDQINVAGRVWTLEFYAGPHFGTAWSRQGHWVVLALGILISLLFFVYLVAALRREELERKLVEKVRQALDARDEFISIAAHELRTPITSLKLQLEMVRRYNNADPAKALARITEVGQKQVRRLMELINELLDVTRIQAGKLRLHPQSTDLNQFVRELADQYENSLAGLGNRLELKADLEPLLADIDPLRLGQAVENLLSNALKYGGQDPIRVEVKREAGRGIIQVQDQGEGIPLDRQTIIFERFERAVQNPDHVGGLGLGLYIAKQIVDAHHGEIIVRSAPGEGSTFRIELPLTP